jgi:Fe-S oxidoreductase
MQVDRLQEAMQTGAKTLITACPKCQIHLTCAQSNTDLDLKVTDLYTYISEHLNEDE